MATAKNLEARIADLEVKVQQLEKRFGEQPARETGDWTKIVGAFANDPMFEEAMRLGREYRESLRPKAKKPEIKKKRSHGDS